MCVWDASHLLNGQQPKLQLLKHLTELSLKVSFRDQSRLSKSWSSESDYFVELAKTLPNVSDPIQQDIFRTRYNLANITWSGTWNMECCSTCEMSASIFQRRSRIPSTIQNKIGQLFYFHINTENTPLNVFTVNNLKFKIYFK